MTSQSVRQAARRAALDAQIRVRRRQEEREQRRSRLGITIVTALAERDAQVELFEQRAAEAVATLIVEEQLTVRDVAEWCGLSSQEVSRLRRRAKTGPADAFAPGLGGDDWTLRPGARPEAAPSIDDVARPR